MPDKASINKNDMTKTRKSQWAYNLHIYIYIYISIAIQNHTHTNTHRENVSCDYQQSQNLPVSFDSSTPPLLSNTPRAVATTRCASSESAEPALINRHSTMTTSQHLLASHYQALFQLVQTDLIPGTANQPDKTVVTMSSITRNVSYQFSHL